MLPDATFNLTRESNMTISMHQVSVPALERTLENLKGILDKAAAHAEARKIDPAVLLQSRLFPDMFPLLRQVQIAGDFAKGIAARLAGQEVPKYEDTETTIEQLKARIDKVLTFVRAIPPAAIDGSEEREIVLTMRGNTVTLKGQAYLINIGLPNFYFHATTAYAILRHNGVEIGKADFLGAP
jgi:uncharacterized protein